MAKRIRTRIPKRIDQFLPVYAEYDAIGNEVSHMQRLLRGQGFQSEIFVDIVNARTADRSQFFRAYEAIAHPDNIAIFHYAIGSALPAFLLSQPQFNISCYHNITPAEYFPRPEDRVVFAACDLGRKQMSLVKFLTDVAWADSKFNGDELEDAGFESPPMVLPLLRDYERLVNLPDDPAIRSGLTDGRATILFVGRLMPHKCQHDLVLLLAAYRELFDPKARLVLASNGSPRYVKALIDLAKQLNLKVCNGHAERLDFNCDVVLLGEVTDQQLASAYRHSQLFFCPSEHEGFCVPLVEAMFFGMPIVANRAGAIPETAGSEASLLIDKNDRSAAIAAIHGVLSDQSLRERLKKASLKRAQAHFSMPKLEENFAKILDRTLDHFDSPERNNS